MGKALVILMLVLGVWMALEIFTKGTDEAFGGLLATSGGSAPREPAEPPMQRIRERVQQSMKAGAARSTSGLDDTSADETDSDEEAGDEE